MPISTDPPAAPHSSATYRVKVLGCKVNQYEAGQIESALEQRGWRKAAPGETAAIEVVHQCAITAEAEVKSQNFLRRARAESPGALLLATGCGARRAGGADRTIEAGPDWIQRLHAALDELRPAASDEPARATPSPQKRPRTRALLKIQDGCDLRCSYCIVPSLRSSSRDVPLAGLVQEARTFAAAGFREIVITGVSVGRWGRDAGGLSAAVRAVAEIPGLERIRLSSLHPSELTDGLLEVWASHPSVLPHLHLPLQSGSDAILKPMRRGYRQSDFRAAVQRSKEWLDRPAFTTDIIVGFPGETEEYFQQTLDFCREIGFTGMHIFPFSPRPGTDAAQLPDRVPSGVIQERIARLGACAQAMRNAAAAQWLGGVAKVLCETRNPRSGEWRGYTERYFPARVAGTGAWRNRIVSMRMESASEGVLRGPALAADDTPV